MSDSITAISCGYFVVDLLCDKLSNLLQDLLFVLQLVVDLCCGLAVGFRFVVDLSYSMLYNMLCNKSKLMESDTNSRSRRKSVWCEQRFRFVELAENGRWSIMSDLSLKFNTSGLGGGSSGYPLLLKFIDGTLCEIAVMENRRFAVGILVTYSGYNMFGLGGNTRYCYLRLPVVICL